MDNFWKAASLVLVTVILGLAIGKTEKDFSVLLTMTACCIVALFAVSYIKPVLDLLWELNSAGELENEFLGILLKAVGITLVAEIAGSICSDAGNSSLGNMLQLLGSATILYLSIPVFHAFLTLIQDVLSEL